MANPKQQSAPATPTAAPPVDLEATLASLLSTKAQTAGTKGVATQFEEVARANHNVVTWDQAKTISPKSPSDAAFYFRQALGKCVTNRTRGGQTTWTVTAYPADVKTQIAQIQAELAAKKQ